MVERVIDPTRFLSSVRNKYSTIKFVQGDYRTESLRETHDSWKECLKRDISRDISEFLKNRVDWGELAII